jgi:excisionase family DNA binding protein
MQGTEYTTQEVAELLQVTTAAVTAWCRSGALPAFRAGSRWRIRKEDLDKFIRRGVPKVSEGYMATA